MGQPSNEPEASAVSTDPDGTPGSGTTEDSKIKFPGSESAQVSFINEYSLPLSDETVILTFMRTGPKLMGPMESLNIQNFHDFEYQNYLEEITNAE